MNILFCKETLDAIYYICTFLYKLHLMAFCSTGKIGNFEDIHRLYDVFYSVFWVLNSDQVGFVVRCICGVSLVPD